MRSEEDEKEFVEKQGVASSSSDIFTILGSFLFVDTSGYYFFFILPSLFLLGPLCLMLLLRKDTTD